MNTMYDFDPQLLELDNAMSAEIEKMKIERDKVFFANPEKGEIKSIEFLLRKFGPERTVGEIYSGFRNIYKYQCPKCEGTGKDFKKISGELGYEQDRYVEIECDLCKGIGYTKEEYKPKMVQDGWEKVEG